MRRQLCKSIGQVGKVDCYIDQCEKDLLLGRSIVTMAVATLAEYSPLWSARLPLLIRTLIIVDSFTTAGYCLTDRCCLLNPWAILKNASGPKSASNLLAGFIVSKLCEAMLLNGRFGYVGLRHWRVLKAEARIRVLLRFLRQDDKLDAREKLDLLAGVLQCYEVLKQRNALERHYRLILINESESL